MNAPCYLCRERPAGHPANPVSAYCAECQPAADVRRPGAFSQCGKCGVTFGTLSAFEDHLLREPGSMTITACVPPARLGLIPDEHGTWHTPAGLADRERKRRQMLEGNARRGRQPQSA